jgi:hypothetical protein
VAVSRWSRLVRTLPVPVFAAAGADMWGPVQELRGHPGVRLMPSPRHASVLLVAGTIPDEHQPALWRVHDQVPHPRAAVGWCTAGAASSVPVVARTGDDVLCTLREAFTALVDGHAATGSDLLPDEDPHEWRGVGPYGQGGEGMMGGTPYGRPMAMTGDDRDGLALDRLSLTLGPFLDPLPGGLVLDVGLQGDILQSIELRSAAAVDATVAGAVTPARRGLQWLSHALHVHGLEALGVRAAQLASAVGDGAAPVDDLRRLEQSIRRSGVLRSLRGVGVIDAEVPRESEHLRGDARDRWERRLSAIAIALREGGVQPALTGVAVEPFADTLAQALAGATVGDAVTAVVSVDFDVAYSRQAEVT